MVISRYLSKELLRTFGAVSVVLLLISLSNKFVKLISMAASGQLPTSMLLQVLVLHLPELFGFICPLAFYLTVLFAFGRLYVDHEMSALSSLGIGFFYRLRVAMSMAFGLFLILSFLTFYLIPQVNLYREKLIGQEESSLLVQTLSAGRFQALKDGRVVFYVEDISKDRRKLKEVFIAEQPKEEKKSVDFIETTLNNKRNWGLITARMGQVLTDKKSGFKYLELSQGARVEGVPGQMNYNVVQFESYGRLIDDRPTDVPYYHRTMPTTMLLASKSLSNKAELHWRIALVISIFVLTLVAVPLSQIKPRDGRFSKLVPGIVIYIAYFNLLTVGKRWVESGKVFHQFGLWWVHGIFALLGLFLCLKNSGFIHYYSYQGRTWLRNTFGIGGQSKKQSLGDSNDHI